MSEKKGGYSTAPSETGEKRENLLFQKYVAYQQAVAEIPFRLSKPFLIHLRLASGDVKSRPQGMGIFFFELCPHIVQMSGSFKMVLQIISGGILLFDGMKGHFSLTCLTRGPDGEIFSIYKR